MSREGYKNGTFAKVHYTVGNFCKPDLVQGFDVHVMAHCVNCLGTMGAGAALAVARTYPRAYEEYGKLFKPGQTMATSRYLGTCQLVEVGPKLFVANLFGQLFIKNANTGQPLIYEALGNALKELSRLLQNVEAMVHVPRIGCGLAGGSWGIVEPLLLAYLTDHGQVVRVYDQPGERFQEKYAMWGRYFRGQNPLGKDGKIVPENADAG
jgi:O-acetyl-ADP-ribose deacetylase (regulator of RNase III)